MIYSLWCRLAYVIVFNWPIGFGRRGSRSLGYRIYFALLPYAGEHAYRRGEL